MSHQKLEEKNDSPNYREGIISEDLKQSFMDCQLSCTSPLPRIWVIETLASSNQVDLSVLLDLLEKTPEISDDLGRNARELVSLRILERVSIEGACANSVSSAASPKIRLDPSERCEDVLQRILTETSASNLKPTGPDMWKWDVQPFIKHKRSSLGKYALQQLKDAILTGSHSFLASLKEQSGLPVGNQPEHVAPVGDGDCDGITCTLEGSVVHRDLPDENLLPVNRKRRATTEKAGEKSCKWQIISKNGCKTRIKFVKKYNHDIIGSEQDVGGKLTTSSADTQLADASAVFVQHNEGESCSLEEKMFDGGLGPNGPPEDNNNECTSLKGLVGPDEILSREKHVPHCGSELNNKTEEEGQDHDIEEAKGDKEGLCNLKTTNEEVDKFKPNFQRNVPYAGEVEEDVDISSDSDRDNHDRTDIATKNNASFSCRRTYNQDSSETSNWKDLSLLAETCKRITPAIEEERCSSGGKTHAGGMGQNGPPEDGNNECTSSKGLVGNIEVLPHEKQAPHCGNEQFDGEQGQDHYAENAEGGSKGLSKVITTNEDMEKIDQNICRNVPNVGESEDDVNISSDSGGHHDERTVIDTKKKTFLSSQCTYSQDSLATTDWRELNLCMKCNKGGKLLVCSSNSCPIVIHESCLGSDASFDTRGKFYCPFCAYSRAISKYTEIKKKASLARKDLATFICLGTRKDSKKQSRRSCRIKENHLEQDDGLPKSSELNKRDLVTKVGNHRRRKKLEYEQAGPSVLSSGYTSTFGGKGVDSTHGIDHTLKKDKQEGKRTRQVSQSPRVYEQHQMAALAIRKSKGENTSCQVPERSDGNEKHAEMRSKKGVLCPPETDLPRESKCSPSNQSADGEEVSEEGNENSHASKYFIRVRKQEGQYSYPAIPQLRRKRLPWTSAEEEALKEGMRIFSSPHDKVIPWTKILEFGAGIFHKSRSTIDLKDKWRNICKAAPKS